MNTTQQPQTSDLIFIGKWTPRILFSLDERPHRYGELRRQVASVSQRMLTRSLRKLEETGLITKRVFEANTIAVEYSLTRLGKTIISPLRGMCRWAKQYRKVVTAEVSIRAATKPTAQEILEILPERRRT
jgi:DNA-binding HxlR family transcriptional regulator